MKTSNNLGKQQLLEDSFFSSSSSSSLPGLSLLGGVVHSDFQRCKGGAKGVFKRIYKGLFELLMPVSRVDPFYFANYLPAVMKDYDITFFTFLCLSRLYYLSSCGVRTLDTRIIKITHVEGKIYIPSLIRSGYIFRSAFVPSSPYLVKNRCIQHVFITFTPKGINLYNEVFNKVYKAAQDDLYNVLSDEDKKK